MDKRGEALNGEAFVPSNSSHSMNLWKMQLKKTEKIARDILYMRYCAGLGKMKS